MQNKQAITLLFLANTISGISQGICMIAIPWYFTAVLGYQSSFGVFYGVLTLISTVWSIYAGVLIDRYNRKKIIISYSVLGLILMSLASIFSYQNIAPLWLISGIVFAFTVLLYNIHYMNIYSFAQEITPPNYYNKVISYLEVQGQFTTILGGALAAILLDGSANGVITIFGFDWIIGRTIEKWSLAKIFALDALTYVLAISILFMIKYSPIQTKKREVELAWERFRAGWNFLKTKPALLIVSWTSSAVFVCVLLISFFLMPSYVSLVLNATSSVFASSELYFALGALLAGFTARYFYVSKHEVTRILLLFGMAMLVFLIFIFNRNLTIFYIANILFGFSNAAIRFNRVSYFWRIVPNQLMGRVSSVANVASYLLRSLWGFVFALPLFEGTSGIENVMLVLFCFILLSGVIIFYYSSVLKSEES